MFPCLRGRGGKEASLEMVYTVQKIDGLTSTGEFSGCLQKNVDVSRARPYESDQKNTQGGKKGGTAIPISAIAAMRSSLQVNISSQAPAGNTCVQCPSAIKCTGIPLPGAFLWK